MFILTGVTKEHERPWFSTVFDHARYMRQSCMYSCTDSSPGARELDLFTAKFEILVGVSIMSVRTAQRFLRFQEHGL